MLLHVYIDTDLNQPEVAGLAALVHGCQAALAGWPLT